MPLHRLLISRVRTVFRFESRERFSGGTTANDSLHEERDTQSKLERSDNTESFPNRQGHPGSNQDRTCPNKEGSDVAHAVNSIPTLDWRSHLESVSRTVSSQSIY